LKDLLPLGFPHRPTGKLMFIELLIEQDITLAGTWKALAVNLAWNAALGAFACVWMANINAGAATNFARRS